MILYYDFMIAITAENCNNSTLTPAGGCVCPWSDLELNCTVVGEDDEFTVWTGTAIDHLCSQEIVLRHQEYNMSDGANENCSSVTGQSLYVDDNCYASKLTIRSITPSLNGMRVVCQYDDGVQTIDIGVYTFSLTRGLPFHSLLLSWL